jgi:hypothetical protein
MFVFSENEILTHRTGNFLIQIEKIGKKKILKEIFLNIFIFYS